MLDYLSYHCNRWRVTQANNLADIALAKNKVKTSGRRKELHTMQSTVRSVSQPPAGLINQGSTSKRGPAGAATRTNNATPNMKVRQGLEDGNIRTENSLMEGSI